WFRTGTVGTESLRAEVIKHRFLRVFAVGDELVEHATAVCSAAARNAKDAVAAVNREASDRAFAISADRNTEGMEHSLCPFCLPGVGRQFEHNARIGGWITAVDSRSEQIA